MEKVLDGDPAHPLQKGTAPYFRPVSIVAKRSPISATAEHLLPSFVVHINTTYLLTYLLSRYLGF